MLDEGAAGAAKVAEPVLSTLAQTTLGAVTLVAVALAVLAVYKLVKVQDQRTKDAQDAIKQYSMLSGRMDGAFNRMTTTIESLVLAENNAQQLQREEIALIQQLKNSIDTTVRDAVLTARAFAPRRDR